MILDRPRIIEQDNNKENKTNKAKKSEPNKLSRQVKRVRHLLNVSLKVFK